MQEDQTAALKIRLANAYLLLLKDRDSKDISINSICNAANIGRSSYYRYLSKKEEKNELLLFKLFYEWRIYSNLHPADRKNRLGYLMASYIYDQKDIFLLLKDKGLLGILNLAVRSLIQKNSSAASSYTDSFFMFGYFGILFQWILRGLQETPDELYSELFRPLDEARGVFDGTELKTGAEGIGIEKGKSHQSESQDLAY